MTSMVKMNWHCIFLETGYQDQCPRNTFQTTLDLERSLFLHHDLEFLGFKLE